MNYYALDENDITNVLAYGSIEHIMETFDIKTKKDFRYHYMLNVPLNGIYIVEDKEDKKKYHEKNVIFDDVLVKETKYGTRYYINSHGYAYSIQKCGKKTILKPTVEKGTYLTVRIARKSFSLAKLVAKNFIPEYEEGMSIVHNDGDFRNNDYRNISLMSRSDFYINMSVQKNKKKIGLFEDGELVREFESIAQASRELFIDRGTIRNYVNGRTKNVVFDLRRI